MNNLNLSNPIKITEQVWGDEIMPIVTIFSWTFNHKDFIKQSIDSILMQKTTFPIEIIIHDDASNDGTKEIILDYQKKYPFLFKNILQTENQWSQGKSVMAALFEKPRGKYIALTHGDDYWTDPLKLQIQVDFLENNENYGAVFTDFTKYYQDSNKTLVSFVNNQLNVHDSHDISRNNFFSQELRKLRTLTGVYRSEFLLNFNAIHEFAAYDTQMIFLTLQKSKIRYLNINTGVYRILKESASHSSTFSRKQLFLETYVELLTIIRKSFPLGKGDGRYISKTILMSKLRKAAHEKKQLKVFRYVFILVAQFHWSRNILRNIKYAFRSR